MVPAPPLAGTVEPGLSTVTAHLDRLEGDVIVFPDDPHAAVTMAQANSAAIAGKLRDCAGAGRLLIARTAVVASREEPALSKSLPTGAEPFDERVTRCGPARRRYNRPP